MKKIINTTEAPKAIGPYSQAVLINNMLFCSGQIAIDAKSGLLLTNNTEEETIQIMKNITSILHESNMDLSDIVKCTIFLKDMKIYEDFNKVYSTYFDENSPARETVQVSRLPKDVNIEISVIAIKE